MAKIKEVVLLILVSFLLVFYGCGKATIEKAGRLGISFPFGAKQESDSGVVAWVYDGDTLQLRSGEKIRLIGIDAPEYHESEKLRKDARRTKTDIKVIQERGRKAYEFTNKLVLGKRVRLEFDVQKKDIYGQLLVYVFLEDDTFLNAEIIKSGHANLRTIPPNTKYADLFRQKYLEASLDKLQ